jgi:hypothetical protein
LNGTPCVVGKPKALITYLENDETVPEFVHYHCLLRVQAHCSHLKTAKEINNCLDTVVNVINYLTSKPLKK